MRMMDTHSLYKNLVQAGLTEKISEVLSNAILQNFGTEKIESLKHEQLDIKTNISIMQNDIANIKQNMVTKAELGNVRTELKEDIANLGAELRRDTTDLRAELKGDINDLRAELKGDIANLRVELKGDTADLRTELKEDIASVSQDLAKLETSIIKWNLGFLVSLVGLFITYLKYFH